MRVTLSLLLALPLAAGAQVDLTPTPLSVRHTVLILQQHVGPAAPASGAPVEWCVADAYRMIASQSDDARLAARLQQTADRYDAAAERRLRRVAGGLPVAAGREVVVQVTDRAVCRTRARRAGPTRG